jgi:hypothetical protein
MRGLALLASTTTTRTRRTAQLSVLVALAAGLALAPTTGAAASAAAVPAAGIKLPVSSAGAMIDVKGQLWVSDPSANQVDVFSSAGTLLHQIKNLPGARALLATPDGSTVEVAESSANAVAQISTTSYTKSPTVWATDPCPSSLAWVTGLLAYSFGCNAGDFSDGVATLASPTSTPVATLSGLDDPPQLAGSGSTLAVSRLGGTTGSIITYSVNENGAASQLAVIAPGEQANVAFSPEGTSLLTAANTNGAVAYDPATGAHQIDYSGTGSSTAVAISPNGRYVATGYFGYTATINLVDTTTDSTVWTRVLSQPSSIGGSTFAVPLTDTLTFSPGSTEAFALASFEGYSGVYLFASVLHPTASHITVKVSNVPAGHLLPVTLTGTPGARVTLKLNVGGLLPRTVGTATLSSSGHAKLTFASTYSGTLIATATGNAAHFPATAHRNFTVASRSRAQILGGHRKHGVTIYKELNSVRILMTTTPASDAAFSVRAQEKLHGHWVSGRVLRAHEVEGRAGIFFNTMQDFVDYRLKFTVSASAAGRASHVTSGVFELR